MDEPEEIRHRMAELAEDAAAVASRVAVCQVIGDALARIGKLVWVTGYIFGPDRKSGASPFRFGDDSAVGIATVVQIGAELISGAVTLLSAGNTYGASALVRQLLEVQYLAAAFAAEQDIASRWLRADHKERRSFWSPAKLREQANGKFLASDYWHHCDLGGHPARDGMRLLPDHQSIPAAFLWVDLAGHIVGIWRHVGTAVERLLGGPIPNDWDIPDVPAYIKEWQTADGLLAAMQDLGAILRETGRTQLTE